jgi:hypothetical protein
MSCRPWEESAPDPETPNPVTPTKLPGAAKTIRMPKFRNVYDFDEPFRKKKKTRTETKKRERHLIVYVPIKRWLTGDRAEMEEEEMMFDVAEEARKEVLLSGFKKLGLARFPTGTCTIGVWRGCQHERGT